MPRKAITIIVDGTGYRMTRDGLEHCPPHGEWQLVNTDITSGPQFDTQCAVFTALEKLEMSL